MDYDPTWSSTRYSTCPLLFILYINDVINSLFTGKLTSYVHDAVILLTVNSWEEVAHKTEKLIDDKQIDDIKEMTGQRAAVVKYFKIKDYYLYFLSKRYISF